MRNGRPASRFNILRAPQSGQGMTLVEIMVAAFILLIALAAIVPFFLTGLSQASTLRYRSLANNIAREKMEEIRQLDYREIYTEANREADPTLGTSTLESLFDTSTNERGADFDIAYVVNVAPYEDGYLKEVTVDVTWDAPPRVSAAKLTTLVHQQFLGPRGSRLVIDPPGANDPLHTPFQYFDQTSPVSSIRYYIAQADWSLVFDNLDTTPVAKDVYMRLALYDENGQTIALGDSANEYKITDLNSHTTDGRVDSVWFQLDGIDFSTIPDGYWELRAVAYNIYEEPGNVWRLMIRVEKDAPAAPTSFLATAQADNQTVVLTWAGGAEKDRARYLIQRRLWDGAVWLPWVTLADDLAPYLSTYTDSGSVSEARDPWGDLTTQHYYEYQLWAEDKSNPPNVGPTTVATAVIPSPTPPTTIEVTTTEPPSTTTTIAPLSNVDIKNLSNANYDVQIKNSSGATKYNGKVNKNKTETVTGLEADSYLITATSTGKPTITQSFTVPKQAGTVVLTIL
jgi:type II secretory pathway pseudopilin PulG